MIPAMPLPGLVYAAVAVPATADFGAIVKALGSVPGCEPQPDALGNIQGVYRIDPDGQGGYALTYPAAADVTAVRAVVNAAVPA